MHFFLFMLIFIFHALVHPVPSLPLPPPSISISPGTAAHHPLICKTTPNPDSEPAPHPFLRKKRRKKKERQAPPDKWVGGCFRFYMLQVLGSQTPPAQRAQRSTPALSLKPALSFSRGSWISPRFLDFSGFSGSAGFSGFCIQI